MSSVISLSERSFSPFFIFPIFLIDKIDLGQVFRVHDPRGQIKTVQKVPGEENYKLKKLSEKEFRNRDRGGSSSKSKEGQPEKRGTQRTKEKKRAIGAQKFRPPD